MRPIKVKADGKKVTFTAEKAEDLTKENINKAARSFAKKEFEDMLKKNFKGVKKR